MRIAIAVLAGWLAVGCSVVGPAASPSSEPVDSPSPGVPTATDDTPPAGNLQADGVSVAGYRGTYCWAGFCADAFELPSRSDLPELQTSADELKFALEGEVGFLSWSASYSEESGAAIVPLGRGGSSHDPDTTATLPAAIISASFQAPPRGNWIVLVQIFFENGDAQYAWHVVVE